MVVDVDLLGEREVPRAAWLLARAFAADPVIGHYLTRGRRRRCGFRAFFGAALYEAMPHGAVYAARNADGLAGVAAWLPPDTDDAPPGRRARLCATTVRMLYPRTGGKLFVGFEGLAALHPHEPHWYLMFVGVEPALQSGGVGAALLAPVLERSDAERVLCYLETPFEQTHTFYRRLGFELGSESKPFEGPAPVWTMTRAPRPGGRTGS